MLIMDWSADVCSSDLWLIPMPDNEAKPMTRPASQVKPAQVPVPESGLPISKIEQHALATQLIALWLDDETVETQILVPILDRTTQQVLMHSLLENKVTGAPIGISAGLLQCIQEEGRSEEHTSGLQSLMRISYAVFCLKKKKTKK